VVVAIFYPHVCHDCVASAGGKISRATVEVQPGATLFLSELSAAHQELNSGTNVPLRLGAFASSKSQWLP
jgi:hypothetical protein